MFQFSGFATFSCSLQLHRLPHSDTGGSRVVCTSPPIFAAYHVLRRLREPRHPPCALISLPSLHLIVTFPSLGSFFLLFPLFRSLFSWLDYPPPLFFCFSLPPSLVNELFVPFYPLSIASQARKTKYSRKSTTETSIGFEPIPTPLSRGPLIGLMSCLTVFLLLRARLFQPPPLKDCGTLCSHFF